MTLRSIDFISALTIVAELGDLRRFPHPREFMG
jgi:transposase